MKIACDCCEKVADVDDTKKWLKVSTEYSKFFICKECEHKFWDIFKKEENKG